MVAPAVREPFGMICLEAMACGTPPIATTTGTQLHVIVPDGPCATGWLVQPDDPEDLAHALITALADADERKRRGTNGRSPIESAYSWSRTADRYVPTYHQAAPRCPRAASSPARNPKESPRPSINGLLLDMNGLFRN
ncbi:glycosyltransferase family 4 protein [Streptomyces olivoreticuli]|uniref:glycosyltransferase family 4 protein n=1 Tax=Streptomyces olivoreticuli TaxID=68246 RepID=UPI000E259EB8|nr:glycosyltransferase family 4 protein [Streptomyces olivoreticuli]